MCPILIICIILQLMSPYTNLDRLKHISFVMYLRRFNLVIVLLLYILLQYSMIGLMIPIFSLAFCGIEKEVEVW